MTKQELIDKLEKDPIEEYVYGTDVDPLVVEGKLNLILKFLKEGDSRGTDVMFDGVYQDIVNFISDPQAQIDSLKSSIAANVDGIAHVEQIKQDKLPQVDLDNIASINQMKDDITGKQDKLSQAQLQAIGEVDAVKSIALQNQSDLTTLASKVETNTRKIPTAIPFDTSDKIKFVRGLMVFCVNSPCKVSIQNESGVVGGQLDLATGFHGIYRRGSNLILDQSTSTDIDVKFNTLVFTASGFYTIFS